MKLASAVILSLQCSFAALAAPLAVGDGGVPARSILKPETIQAIEATLLTSNIPGMSIAITTKDKDELLSFGNATIYGDPVDEEVRATYLLISHDASVRLTRSRRGGVSDPIVNY